MSKAFAVFCLAIAIGVTFGYVAWAVIFSGGAVFGALLLHRLIQRLGLVRMCRLAGAWFWSSGHALEALEDRMKDARKEIGQLEAKRAEQLARAEVQ